MSKAKEMLYPVGVDDLFIAFMTNGKDAIDAIPTYDEEIYRIATIETIGIAGNPTSVTKWASSKIFVNVMKNGTFTLTLDHTALPIEVTDKMHGYMDEKGIAFDTDEVKEYPYFAIGFITELSGGEKLARWYPRVQINLPEESYGTGNAEATVPTQQLTMTATPLLFNRTTKADFNSARDSAVGVSAEDFMTQVVCDKSELETLFPSIGVTVEVTPESASVAVSGTEQLTAKVAGATDTNISWSSSDELIATVDSSGLVTIDPEATTGETVTITATSVEDGTKTATAKITVA